MRERERERERETYREREREREREKDGSDVTIVALKLATSFALFLAKNVHLRLRLHVYGYVARYPDIRVEGTRVSAKRLHVSRYPELLYDTHAQCGTNIICARVSKVPAVLQRGFFRVFLSFMKVA